MRVWTLDGALIQFIDSAKVMNNVDLRYNFPLSGTFGTGQPHTSVALVGVNNEPDDGVTFYKVNPFSSPPGMLEHANGNLQNSTLPAPKDRALRRLHVSQPGHRQALFLGRLA